MFFHLIDYDGKKISKISVDSEHSLLKTRLNKQKNQTAHNYDLFI